MPAPSGAGCRAALTGAAAAALALLSGCVIAPLGHHYPTHPAEGPEVDTAPPPPYAETPPAPPAIGYVWIGGHWGWHLGRHVWIGGRWALPPRGYRGWAPGHWHRHGPRWRYRGGHWHR
jgi:hypothetical protein